MAFRYIESNPIYYPHRPPRQHRQQLEDDYLYYTLPSRAPPQQPPPTFLHDQYYYGQYYHDNRIHPDYYQSLPKRKNSGRRHKLSRSSSTGNLQREYEDLQQTGNGRVSFRLRKTLTVLIVLFLAQNYSWYYEEQKQHVPHHYERCRRNSSNNKESSNQQRDAEAIIDLDSYAHIDGEPMNELEVLAAKNAAINERKSRIIYQEFEQEQQVSQQKQPNETIQVATAHIPVTETMVEAISEEENLSNMLDSLTMTDSNASTVVEPIVDNIKDQLLTPSPSTSSSTATKKTTTTTKKKRWPFAFLFKKPTSLQNVEPTKSTSIPPTPVLTPDTFSSSSISSTTQTTSPHHQVSTHGFWAFRVPMTQVWFRFDNENQRKIHEHVSLPNGVLQLTDSHFGGSQVPMVVLPFQRVCYYPTDVTLNQLACLELSFMPATHIGSALY